MKFHHPADTVRDVVQDMLDRHGKPPELALNCLPDLNSKIWGFRRKKLVVVGARTSMGKTVFLLNCLLDFLKQGKKVVFFTLEMTKESCVQRLINNYCSIDNVCNLKGISQEEHDLHQDKINEFYEFIDKSHCVIIESWGKTVKEVSKAVEALGTDIDVVMVDYIQNISVADKKALDDYVKDLRTYAINKNFCAIVASQINRGIFDSKVLKTPDLHELKGSGCIEETADMAILLHWAYHYDSEQPKNEYHINIAKNRDGRTGVHECIYEPEYFRLRERRLSDAESTESGTDTGNPYE